jgi:hypothetical protein
LLLKFFLGLKQAYEVGRQLVGRGVDKILCSPMIRTVQTADCVAEMLGLGPNSICVEYGLVEEAKSFRGKTRDEPMPNWEPLILPVSELCKYSNRIDTSYTSLHPVLFIRDESTPNTLREHHDTITVRDEITRDRCRQFIWKMVLHETFDGQTILCVGHGATVGGCHKALEVGLPEELFVHGDRTVSCYSEFAPVDPTVPTGSWKSVSGIWETGDIFDEAAAEDAGDRGILDHVASMIADEISTSTNDIDVTLDGNNCHANGEANSNAEAKQQLLSDSTKDPNEQETTTQSEPSNNIQEVNGQQQSGQTQDQSTTKKTCKEAKLEENPSAPPAPHSCICF